MAGNGGKWNTSFLPTHVINDWRLHRDNKLSPFCVWALKSTNATNMSEAEPTLVAAHTGNFLSI